MNLLNNLMKFMEKVMSKYCLMFLFYLFFYSCTQDSYLGISDTIKDSKRNGMYAFEYTVPENPYKINDTMQITVKEAWLENHWEYSSSLNKIISYDGYQIVINSKKEDIKGLGYAWTIGTKPSHYFRRCSNRSIVTDFEIIPPDTIVYLVQQGVATINVAEENKCGELILIKKQ